VPLPVLPSHRIDIKKLALSLGAACSLAAVTAFGVAPATDADLPVQYSLTEPVTLRTQVLEPSNILSQSERVRRGETLASLFGRIGLDDPEAIAHIRRHPAARPLLDLRAGRVVSTRISPEGKLERLSYRLNEPTAGSLGRRLVITRSGEQFATTTEPVPFSRSIETRSAEIQSTLVQALDAADIPDSVLTRMADVFGNQVDLSRAKPGDRLRVVYETLTETGTLDTPVVSRILAVEYVSGKTSHEAIWFGETTLPDGSKGAYFTFDGRSLNRSFLASPLEVTRVSSGYLPSRFHPALQHWRAHKGVDLRAPIGTRVRSVADGVVDYIGARGGYGNVIVIKHNAQQSTLYAHLQDFAEGLRPGTRVAQGETIGTVGMTGWTTGPHLHFEFLVNGVHVDPMSTIAAAPVRVLSAAERVKLQSQARIYRDQFEVLGTRYAARFE
jgi:murein DD-endopeptidase MepM/ murein hydrolase activator NlpD